jgi:hypothetical protein
VREKVFNRVEEGQREHGSRSKPSSSRSIGGYDALHSDLRGLLHYWDFCGHPGGRHKETLIACRLSYSTKVSWRVITNIWQA